MRMHVLLCNKSAQKPELYGIVLKNHTRLNVDFNMAVNNCQPEPKSVKSFWKVAGNIYGVFFNTEADRDKVLALANAKIEDEPLNVSGYFPVV